MSNISNTGITPSITMGGVTLPLSMAIILHAANGTTLYYDSLRRNGAHYQVPVGKKLVIVALKGICTSAGQIFTKVGYGNAAVSNTAAAPAGDVPIVMNGVDTGINSTAAVAGNEVSVPTYFEVPAGKYPYARSQNLPVVTMIGYLVSV